MISLANCAVSPLESMISLANCAVFRCHQLPSYLVFRNVSVKQLLLHFYGILENKFFGVTTE